MQEPQYNPQTVYPQAPQQPIQQQPIQQQPIQQQSIHQQPIQQPVHQQYIQQPVHQQQPYQQQPIQQPVQPPVQQQQLSVIDQVFGPNSKLFVKQRFELFEFVTGIETQNKYDVQLENGLQVVCLEESSFLARMCLQQHRPFTMHCVFAANKHEFMKLERPWTFCLSEIHIKDHTNKLLGKVVQKCSFCTRDFNVYDENNNLIYYIHSPCCSFWTFYIQDLNRQNVGTIKKKWSGLIKELYTDADNFGVQFPNNATPTQKAILFGGVFLIDFLYFEENHKNR